MTITELRGDEPELADRLAPILGADGVTPSAAARKAKMTTTEALRGLSWMADNHFARTSGNGSWTRYHKR